mmetsp:Transcript_8758/g.15891  ORF Transcript_8758/g.15891 Transcript_8758/m.15891 type:complete len:210 (-) Transcript_8758:1085-1714(-)
MTGLVKSLKSNCAGFLTLQSTIKRFIKRSSTKKSSNTSSSVLVSNSRSLREPLMLSCSKPVSSLPVNVSPGLLKLYLLNRQFEVSRFLLSQRYESRSDRVSVFLTEMFSTSAPPFLFPFPYVIFKSTISFFLFQMSLSSPHSFSSLSIVSFKSSGTSQTSSKPHFTNTTMYTVVPKDSSVLSISSWLNVVVIESLHLTQVLSPATVDLL